MCVSCRDICPLLKDPAALTAVIDLFEEHVKKNHKQVDLIIGKKTKQTSCWCKLALYLMNLKGTVHRKEKYSSIHLADS